jgi:hypothetical protein
MIGFGKPARLGNDAIYCWGLRDLVRPVQAGLDCIPVHVMSWVDDPEGWT